MTHPARDMRWREAPIPDLGVVITSGDAGEVIAYVSDPKAWGDHDHCVEWISRHKPPRGCRFDLMYVDSGRLASWVGIANKPNRIQYVISEKDKP